MEDIVYPGKENEFSQMAKKLGIDKVVFVYDKPSKEGASSKPGKGYTVVKGSERNREIIERGHAKVLYDIEGSKREDFMHHRNSGLNQVLCKIMAVKKVAYGISFRKIMKTKGYSRAILLGRIMQNVRLCKKYKVKIRLCSFARSPMEMRNPKDLIEFGKLLGI